MTKSLQTLAVAIAAILLSVTAYSADNFKFRGFSGGMTIHTGYMQSRSFAVAGTDFTNFTIKGAAAGIGGQFKLHFGSERHLFRTGMDGYGSNVFYKPQDSYFHAGWATVLFDYIYCSKSRVHPYIGFGIGGGLIKNHLITDGSDLTDFGTDKVMMRKYVFIPVVPYIGMEISVTEKLRINIKADYMMNALGNRPDFAKGVRIYFGVLFYTKK